MPIIPHHASHHPYGHTPSNGACPHLNTSPHPVQHTPANAACMHSCIPLACCSMQSWHAHTLNWSVKSRRPDASTACCAGCSVARNSFSLACMALWGHKQRQECCMIIELAPVGRSACYVWALGQSAEDVACQEVSTCMRAAVGACRLLCLPKEPNKSAIGSGRPDSMQHRQQTKISPKYARQGCPFLYS